jgi:hypothetical protein
VWFGASEKLKPHPAEAGGVRLFLAIKTLRPSQTFTHKKTYVYAQQENSLLVLINLQMFQRHRACDLIQSFPKDKSIGSNALN